MELARARTRFGHAVLIDLHSMPAIPAGQSGHGARIVIGDWQWTDAMVPVAMVAVFPFFEWVVHVVILHWRPRAVGAMRVDPLLARKHREHHADPRRVDLIFIPWRAQLWVQPGSIAIALLAFPRPALGLTFLATLYPAFRAASTDPVQVLRYE